MAKYLVYHNRDCFINTNVMQVPRLITDVNTIAFRLKSARDEASLTQQELADKAGVSQGTVANIESGARKNPRELLAIAKAVGVYPEWLKSGKAPRHIMKNEAEHNEQPTSAIVVDHDKNTKRAPVVEWGRLGVELQIHNREFDQAELLPVLQESSDYCKWARVDRDLPSFRIRRGYLLAFDPVKTSLDCIDGELYLFKAFSGELFIAEFRRLAGHAYEALLDNGPPLDSERHGIVIIARNSAIHKPDSFK
jgi:transcriptional regulator with XRE-family HTH domain